MGRNGAAVLLAAALAAAPGPAQERSLPEGWAAFTISSCEDHGAFGSGLSRAAVARQYARYEVVAQAGARKVGPALRWRFQVRGDGSAELHTTFPLRRDFDALSLWLKNPLDHDLTLGVKLVEGDGSEYVTEGLPLRGETGWRQLTFAVGDCKLAADSSDENAALDFPLAKIVMLAHGARAGQEYELYLDEIEGRAAPPGIVRVESFSAPTSAASGDTLQVELALAAPEGEVVAEALEVSLGMAGVDVAVAVLALPKPPNAWGMGEVVRGRAEGLRAPSWAARGLYDLALRGRRLRVQNAAYGDGVFARVNLDGPDPRGTEVSVREHGGVPTLFMGGRPHTGLGYLAVSAGPEDVSRMAAAGLHLATVPATSDYDLYGLAGDVWLDEETFDYSDLDARARLILEADAEAHLVLRVYMCSPAWWDRKHLNECVLFASGHHAANLSTQARKNTYPSWSSKLWRRDAGEALRRFVRHVEQSPYGHRVLGYQLASGETGSWDFWGFHGGHFGDYSPPEKAAFQRWLRTKYNNDRRAFLEAWGPDPRRKEGEIEYGRRFTTAAIPTKAERLKRGPKPAPDTAVLDPAYDQPVIDYQLFSAERTAEAIEHFAQIAQEASGGRKLVGAAYGEVFDHSWPPCGLQNGGHLALAKLLRSASLDFIAGSYYQASGAPGEHNPSPFASASVKARGKLWFDQNRAWDTGARNVAEAIAPQRHQFGKALAEGAGMTWLDMDQWGHDSEMQAALARLSGVAQAFLGQDRRSAAQVALVLDERSLCFTKADNGLVRPMLAQQAAELAKLGAPFDVCLLTDVVEGRVGPYRMYVFAGTLVMDGMQRQVLHRVLAAGRRTAVWVYAPGCIDELQLPKQVKELTGVRVTLDSKPAPLRVSVADMDDPYTEGVGGVVYGTAKPVAPVYYIIDEEAHELGELLGKNRPGLCVTEGPGGFTSVYSVAPALPGRLLRNIARQAGVHIYSDRDDVLYVGRRLLAVWADEGGDRRLLFPAETSVYDLLAGDQLARRVRELPLSLPRRSVGLYFLGEGADLGLR